MNGITAPSLLRDRAVNWDQWQTLLAVSRTGTYAEAARILQIDATTVGRRLKMLQNHLGFQLFVRHEGRLHPTNPVQALLVHIETAFEALRAAEHESGESGDGTVWRNLRMTAPPFIIRNLFAPNIATIADSHRVRIELLGTASNITLTRREADLAIRIDDRPPAPIVDTEQIASERIGTINYAVYCQRGVRAEHLPWAGLVEEHVRTTGSDAMAKIAGRDGFQYRALHFDVLQEFAASGIARALLPCFVADEDHRLSAVSETVLQQPLTMLYHRQDQEIVHLKSTRAWVRGLCSERLARMPTTPKD